MVLPAPVGAATSTPAPAATARHACTWKSSNGKSKPWENTSSWGGAPSAGVAMALRLRQPAGDEDVQCRRHVLDAQGKGREAFAIRIADDATGLESDLPAAQDLHGGVPDVATAEHLREDLEELDRGDLVHHEDVEHPVLKAGIRAHHPAAAVGRAVGHGDKHRLGAHGDPVDLDDIRDRLEDGQLSGNGQVVAHPAAWPPPGVGTLVDHGVEPRAKDAGEPVRDAMGIGMAAGVDGTDRAAGYDPGGGGRVMKGQMQGAGDVVTGPGRDDGQKRRGAGAEVDPEVDRA